MSAPPNHRTLFFASVLVAFAASLLAIRERADVVEAGYRLSQTRADGAVLRREALRAQRSLAWASSPQVVLERAKKWGMGFDVHVLPAPTADAAVPASGADRNSKRRPQ